MRNPVKTLAAVTLLAGLLGTSAGAQQPAATTLWRAWLGCWASPSPDAPLAGARTPVVCVSPTESADVARFTTIAHDSVTSTQLVDASGRAVPLQMAGCTGTQVGRWSSDRRRVYLSATARCDGATRTTRSIVAMSPSGEWIDVQGIGADGMEGVRVARYRGVQLDVQGAMPADVARALREGGLSVQSARMVAGADIGVPAVVEAAQVAGVAVTEAYIMERRQRFTLDAPQLVALADAGVSPRITDALIAVSNPGVFAVSRPADVARDAGDDAPAGRRVYVTLDRYASPFGWGYDPYLRYGRGYDDYGYNRLGIYGAGYPGAGYPGYITGGPVIIVKGTPEPPHGRLVKGHGYEAGDRTGAARTPDRIERETTRPDTRGATAESTRASTPSGSSGSDKPERVAKPRP